MKIIKLPDRVHRTRVPGTRYLISIVGSKVPCTGSGFIYLNL